MNENYTGVKLTWEELPEQVRSILPQDAGPGVRMAAAKGLLPMGTQELVVTLVYLHRDDDEQIAKAAQESIDELPPNLIDTALASQATPWQALDFFARRELALPAMYERILLNPTCANETIIFLAETLTDIGLIDIIAANQTRLVQAPQIYNALRRNSAVPRAIRDRVEQFLRLLNIEAPEDREFEEFAPPVAEGIEPQAPEAPSTEASAMDEAVESAEHGEQYDDLVFDSMSEKELKQHVDLDKLAKESFEKDEEFAKEFLVDPDQELTGTERSSMAFRVKKMRVMDQIKMALKGSLEARMILIKSPNKIIQECVLQNPRITIEEVLKLSRDKTAREELIRIIANSREWTKNYQTKLALVNNPKTPIPLSLKYMTMLNDRDLAHLSKSKQVPGILAVTARKALADRQRFK
ncbi:MAG: hypothetical protein P9M14_12645 [Candidatus Alcyoniella australis]|nr:hypothetical protein [Candidatus Alcyoniella australis]